MQVTQADLKLFFESICGEVGYFLLHTSFPFLLVVSLHDTQNDKSSSTMFIHLVHNSYYRFFG
jgi:hypothetical protein